jgi:hypothetical protein
MRPMTLLVADAAAFPTSCDICSLDFLCCQECLERFRIFQTATFMHPPLQSSPVSADSFGIFGKLGAAVWHDVLYCFASSWRASLTRFRCGSLKFSHAGTCLVEVTSRRDSLNALHCVWAQSPATRDGFGPRVETGRRLFTGATQRRNLGPAESKKLLRFG